MKRKPASGPFAHRRQLTPEEAELWYQVQKTATPMPGRKPLLQKPSASVPAKPASAVARQAAARGAPANPGVAAEKPAQGSATGPGVIDEPTLRKLKKGRLAIDDVLDLHGMTQERAHAALARFLSATHAAGGRIVLIITGKGPGGDGVLRRQVPNWLRQAPLSGLVSGIREAHAAHGGSGALYVRLRKPEKMAGRQLTPRRRHGDYPGDLS